MKKIIRLALAQINTTVGDLEGNCAKILEYSQRAKDSGADIVCYPELSITGYPPEDLVLKPKFIRDNLRCLHSLAKSVKGPVAIVGFVDAKERSLFNAAAVISGGKIKGIYHKMHLPNYGVFDEKRYFQKGGRPLVFELGDFLFGVNICEDIWHDDGPIKAQAQKGARLVLNINASPYYAGKIKERERAAQAQAKENHICIAYTNLVGAQDELVFDGRSMVVDEKGRVVACAEAFKEDLLVVDVALPLSKKRLTARPSVFIATQSNLKEKKPIAYVKANKLSEEEEIYQALLLGLRDYVEKNGFKKVVLGLSGGIDSALVAVMAKDALGKENVTGVFMPSRYSSQESFLDAQELARNLGIKFFSISCEQIYKIYLMLLEPHFAGTERNIAEENIQARIRGTLLMALSNKFGWLVLATGNKSEMSTGYATLYGDMAGGFAVIKDVPKMLVYRLARFKNSLEAVIPERTFTKAPTAELKPNQKDSDTLPDYETLDKILKAYVEEDKEMAQIVALGFEKDTVAKVLGMVDKSEYKRRQAPPGIKITPKAFGRDRRMPITNKYQGSS